MERNNSMGAQLEHFFLQQLKQRFEENKKRHPNIVWADVEKKLLASQTALEALYRMDQTGGEPDVIGADEKTGEYLFADCAEQSPQGRRSLCYDAQALLERKKNPPKNSAQQMADEMGISILSEEEYRSLQTLGEFDTKTSSWVKTPKEIRTRGGALFCDRRYDHVFTYHNGADSYYSQRGFRGMLRV